MKKCRYAEFDQKRQTAFCALQKETCGMARYCKEERRVKPSELYLKRGCALETAEVNRMKQTRIKLEDKEDTPVTDETTVTPVIAEVAEEKPAPPPKGGKKKNAAKSGTGE